MNKLIRHTCIGLLCPVMALLASCRTTPPDNTGPTLNLSLSSPGLVATVSQGGYNAAVYDYFNNASSEAIFSNPDNLQTVTIDTSGYSGQLVLQPASTQTPGIYQLRIQAGDDSDSRMPTAYSYNDFLVYVQPSSTAVIDFPMSGVTSPSDIVRTTVTLFIRNGLTNPGTQNFQLLAPGSTPVVPAPTLPATPVTGVTVNNITVIPSSASDTATIEADLSIAGGTQPFSLEFAATPPDNGYSPAPYTETVQIVPQ